VGADAEETVSVALRRMGLLPEGQRATLVALTGGVSSDIWRVDLPRGPVCIKRALPRLRVEAEWYAPVERNAYEVAWIRCAGAIVPDAVPEILGEDPELGMFVMSYLDPAEYPLWKTQLANGDADGKTAKQVGERLLGVHSGTAGDGGVRSRFDTDDMFRAIRLDPYLLATGRAHPDLAMALEALSETTLGNKRALVHGDISPKNIPIGERGPIFLDAECAWYGDPAFDLAFCLNHLLLKCLLVPEATDRFLACFDVLASVYLAGVDWEPGEDLERRAARLLPGLLLARVDGKSPVEYLNDETDKEHVRRVTGALLKEPPARLAQVSAAWRKELAA
jgi:aminoglycoside phosphotransferase (APT) family kinase protein